MGIAGLKRGVEWIEEQGLEQIRRHEMELAVRLVEGLREIPEITLYGGACSDRHLPVICCNVEGIGTSPTGTVRLSIGPFNTAEHVDAAIAALADVASMRRVS